MANFLRQILAVIIGGFLLGALTLGVLVGSFEEELSPTIKSSTLLVLDLSLPLADDPVPAAVSELLQGGFGSDPTPMQKMIEGIRSAAEDPRIVGLHLQGGVAVAGWAGLGEIRAALDDFRATGKKVTAWFPALDEASLFLGSAADRLWVAPFGGLVWNGMLAESQYFGEAFRRHGIEVQVTRVGRYKSAVEPWLLDHMSEDHRQQLTVLLGDLEQQRTAVVAGDDDERRGLLDRIAAQQGLLTGPQAVAEGLVDGVLHQDEVDSALREITGQDEDEVPRTVSLEQFLAESWQQDPWMGGGMIAVIYAEGEIVDGWSDAEVGGDRIAAALRDARLDPEVAAVVLRVNSPGGSASASEVIRREVELCAAAKPLVVSMGDVAASGGYWISASADEIFAGANTITGSIGVFGMWPNLQGLAEQFGVQIESVQTSPHANLGSLWQSKSSATLAALQASVDEVYDAFLERVATGRGMSVAEVHEIAQGRVWSGKRALEIGLVDHLGGLNDAIERAASLAGLEDFAVDHRWRQPDLWQLWFARIARENLGVLPLSSDVLATDMRRTLHRVYSLGQARGLQARLPWDWVSLR